MFPDTRGSVVVPVPGMGGVEVSVVDVVGVAFVGDGDVTAVWAVGVRVVGVRTVFGRGSHCWVPPGGGCAGGTGVEFSLNPAEWPKIALRTPHSQDN